MMMKGLDWMTQDELGSQDKRPTNQVYLGLGFTVSQDRRNAPLDERRINSIV